MIMTITMETVLIFVNDWTDPDFFNPKPIFHKIALTDKQINTQLSYYFRGRIKQIIQRSKCYCKLSFDFKGTTTFRKDHQNITFIYISILNEFKLKSHTHWTLPFNLELRLGSNFIFSHLVCNCFWHYKQALFCLF